ncbi:MAG: hypothetical protein LBV43_05450 [Prevotella sp.]|jgi:hypothetical protein|nr:hypothetical protein [Prevotella sp.]
MSCKLQSNITKNNCNYTVAGVKAVYLFNYDSANTYELGTNGEIDTIALAENNAKAYKIDFVDGTASFTDDLAENGNGGKYRTHTLNFSISNYDYNILNEDKALSLGRYTAVVVDKSGRAIILGRNNGLSATSFNYSSGAADADANGWTVVMAGTELEMGRLLKDESVIKAITEPSIIIP